MKIRDAIKQDAIYYLVFTSGPLSFSFIALSESGYLRYALSGFHRKRSGCESDTHWACSTMRTRCRIWNSFECRPGRREPPSSRRWASRRTYAPPLTVAARLASCCNTSGSVFGHCWLTEKMNNSCEEKYDHCTLHSVFLVSVIKKMLLVSFNLNYTRIPACITYGKYAFIK